MLLLVVVVMLVVLLLGDDLSHVAASCNDLLGDGHRRHAVLHDGVVADMGSIRANLDHWLDIMRWLHVDHLMQIGGKTYTHNLHYLRQVLSILGLGSMGKAIYTIAKSNRLQQVDKESIFAIFHFVKSKLVKFTGKQLVFTSNDCP